ncbi:MAG: hypothetical protein DMG04_00185 [Acidobacteria bacterium]|nr:MAG: hypothetical protein DMG04_00185 [Acidobacteriota bacterium]
MNTATARMVACSVLDSANTRGDRRPVAPCEKTVNSGSGDAEPAPRRAMTRVAPIRTASACGT